ncbi:MAG: D-alanine--D-alanine ligase A [Flavobacteriales bacterium]|nr:D-alanine--D-alanine ligase A [Flavobacteriales bacterium]
MENIAIIMGGTSKENKISLKSADTIYNHIDQTKYNAYKVLCLNNSHFDVMIKNLKIKIDNTDFSFMLNNRKITFQKVFMMIHGDPGENGKLCSYFNSKNIPYTSCDEASSILTFNKFKCNNHLKSIGYQVPSAQLYQKAIKTKFPCIIKPASSGSSFGISKVYNNYELEKAVLEAIKHDKEVIIEEFIEGREFTCAVFNLNHKIETLPITEIISENDIFDYDAKYNGKSVEQTPAKIDDEMRNKIHNISKSIYQDLNLSGIVRIDFIISQHNPYIIEINTIPGFSEESIVPQMLKCANITLKQFITSQLNNI